MSEDPFEFSGASFSGSFSEIETRRSFLNSLVGKRIADRYQILRVLGEGGMGVVTEARHVELEQNVAIKFMFPEFISNEVLNARFSREAKLAAKVQSPHIVRVSDVGRLPSGVPYLVMDLLAGRDLGAELESQGVLPVERAVDYTLQACAGVAALHSIGVIHRDLKPSNLFVADVAGVPTVKVLDFGISKDVTAPAGSITSTETQLGTPMYMSPEQIRASKDVNMRSDIWSLGVILYELLTGTLPFERTGHSVGELFAVILMTEPSPLCMRRPELPQALEDAVMKCLRRNSWERHESVAAFAQALRPFIKPGTAHRVEAVRRALGDTQPSSDLAAAEAARSAAAVLPTVAHPVAIMPVTPAAPAAPGGPASVAASSAAEGGERALDEGSSALRLEVDYPPSRPQSVPRERPNTPILTSTRASPPPTEGTAVRTGLMWGLGIAATIVGAAATFVIRASSTPPSSATGTEAPTPTPQLQQMAEPAVPPPPPLQSSPPPPPPPESLPTASSLSHAPAAPRVPTMTVARPPKPTPSAAPPPPPAPAATHPPRTEDLILDRK
jgi:serine/threonine-protein kinase